MYTHNSRRKLENNYCKYVQGLKADKGKLFYLKREILEFRSTITEIEKALTVLTAHWKE